MSSPPIERFIPLRFRPIASETIALPWSWWSPPQALFLFVVGVALRVWLFHCGGLGDRLLARFWHWDNPEAPNSTRG